MDDDLDYMVLHLNQADIGSDKLGWRSVATNYQFIERIFKPLIGSYGWSAGSFRGAATLDRMLSMMSNGRIVIPVIGLVLKSPADDDDTTKGAVYTFADGSMIKTGDYRRYDYTLEWPKYKHWIGLYDNANADN